MRTVTRFFSAVGILAGLLFAAGGLWYGRFMGLTFVITPVIIGLVIIAIHALSLARLRSNSSRVPRWLLIATYLALLALFILGQIHIVETRLHGALFLWVFGCLYLVPFVINLIYWTGFSRPRAETHGC